MSAIAERITSEEPKVAASATRLRIGVVTPELHRRGGTERGNAEVVARLAQDHDICLFAHHWEPDGTPNICFHPVPVLPWPGLVRYLSFFLSATWQVKRAAARHGSIDAVYSPGPNCRQVEVSSAWFCQARQLELFRSGKHRPPPVSVVDWLKLAHRWSYCWTVSRVEKMFYSLPTLKKVVTQSNLLAGDLQSFYGLDPRRVVVAHGGVNCGTFSQEERQALRAQARKELGLADGQFVFFFIGNNWLIKGLCHVLRALAAVPDARLMIVGADVERPESWKALAEQLGVADRIGYLPRRRDVIFYYAAADALLAPSVYDTFPLMPMEAMACGLPTIISRRTGIAEIVRGEETLVVEQLDDPAELALAMRRMAGDDALRARLVANGLCLARANPWDRIYRAVSEELLATAQANVAARQVAKES